ncbi:MFS transporter [Halobacillus litoralis]|uniref:MFS transporter n=1 Tax=Halobacillus litoralis TaxID=45668 RepID=A0A845DU17_9BACI|nr:MULTISPECIES: MFS transporter [Halobacillus]MCA1020836.1 MFS transporter [Halobacillus litoralis]MYL20329.1 MFS transporter [Halobacillus litoralis]MYL29424.1 MFS transporter [Halobacillus halophilus]MYL36641.1 MFS transporter [Halobacillus litoralis]
MHKPKLWTWPFIFLILANLFTFMSFQMLLPNLPPYIESIGGSTLEVGLITTTFAFAAIVIRPFIGHLLMTRARKLLILIGSTALLILTMMYPVTQVVFFLLVIRFIHGLAWGWSTTVNGTAAVDLVPRRRVGEGMGYFGLSVTVGMIMAPSLGIYLYQNYSFSLLVWISAALGIIALLLFSVTSFTTPDQVYENQKNPPRFSFKDALIEKRSWYPALVTILNTFGYGAVVTYIVIFGNEQGLDGTFLFYFFNAVLATVSRPITGRYFDKRGPWNLIIVCSVISFIAMWVLATADSNLDLIIAGALFGAGYGSMMPALQAWVISKTSIERSGIANGMYYSSIDLGIGASALVLGFIYQFVNTAALFKLSSFLFLVVMVLTIIDLKKQTEPWQSPQ